MSDLSAPSPTDVSRPGAPWRPVARRVRSCSRWSGLSRGRAIVVGGMVVLVCLLGGPGGRSQADGPAPIVRPFGRARTLSDEATTRLTEQIRQAALQGTSATILLRGGRVLSGQIAQSGEHLLLTWPDGSQARFPLADVEAVGASRDDLYHEQVRRTPPIRIEQKLALAEWCLQQNLPARAADQYLAAALTNPQHPGLASLGRRLDQIAESSLPFSESSTGFAPGASGGSTSLIASSPNGADRPGGAVRAVAHEEAGLSVGPALYDEFQRHWQPLLLRSCAAAECHDAESKHGFALIRGSRSTPLTRKMTESNLAAVLEHLSPEGATSSRLLGVHGLQEGRPDPIAWPQTMLAQLPGLTRFAERLAPSVTAFGSAGRLAEGQAAVSDGTRSDRGRGIMPASVITSHYQAEATADPYDPMVFNRTYHASAHSPGDPSESADHGPHDGPRRTEGRPE